MFVHNTLFITLVLTIIEEVLVYKECKTDDSNQVASLIITLLTTVFTIMAVVSLLRVYTRYKAEYQGTRILRRFWVR
jgi:membrane protein YdbS with pleckstrin-like domain